MTAANVLTSNVELTSLIRRCGAAAAALASLRAFPLSRPVDGLANSAGLMVEPQVYPCCAAVFASHEATVCVSSLYLA